MSGICGIVDFAGTPPSAKLLQQMARSAAGRGCDGYRVRVSGEIGLVQMTLCDTLESVSDGQPLSSPDDQIHLVADLRLDNRKDLISQLESWLQNDSPGDGELVLAAYQRWGTGCSEHLLGDFALAVWDSHEKRFFCARDPLGIKPLHFARLGSLLLFASEAQQILQHPAVSRRLDEITVGSYLCGMSPGLERTLFRDIRFLQPAHRLIADSRGVRQERYWDIDPERRTTYRRGEDYAARFNEIFHAAVTDRLRASGTAVGVAMSGGLDSCSVAAVAHRELRRKQSAPHLIAASLVFTHLSECDERSYIRSMVSALDIEALEVEAEQFWTFKDPVIDRPSLETLYMSFESCFQQVLGDLRKRGCRVMLTGNGGDEVVTGSGLVFADSLRKGDLRAVADILRHARRRHKSGWRALYYYAACPFLPQGMDRVLRRLTGRSPEFSVPGWLSKDFLNRNSLVDYWRQQARAMPRFQEKARQAVYDATLGLGRNGAAIYWYNRVASNLGMEIRHPFLDRRLIEYVLSIPPQQLFEAGTTKPLLRQAMMGKLPESVRQRQGKTNLVSYSDWSIREKEARTVEELLAAPMSAQLEVSDGDKLRAAFQRYRGGELTDETRSVVYAIALEFWLRKHYASDGNLGLEMSSYPPRSVATMLQSMA